jgi:hypothetical protein
MSQFPLGFFLIELLADLLTYGHTNLFSEWPLRLSWLFRHNYYGGISPLEAALIAL